VLYKVPVKIVTVRFRKPRPSENTVQDLAHFVSFCERPTFTIRPYLLSCQILKQPAFTIYAWNGRRSWNGL